MKRFLSIAAFILCFAAAGLGSAQTAAQYLNAGNQFYSSGDYAKAAQYYEAAVSMDPNSSAAYQGLGNCRYYQGDKAGALKAYEKALALDPGNAQLSTFAESLRAQVGSSPSAQPMYSSQPSASKSDTGKKSSLDFDVMAGVAVPLSDGLGIGFGGNAAARVPLGQGLALGGALGFYTFGSSISGADISYGSLEILASAKYTLPGGGGSIAPYLVGGAGMSMWMASLLGESSSSFYPMVQAGGGVSFPGGKDMKLFGEAKISMILGDGGTITYVPVNFGASFAF